MLTKQTSTVHVYLFQTPLYQKGPQTPLYQKGPQTPLYRKGPQTPVAGLWLRTPTSLPQQL